MDLWGYREKHCARECRRHERCPSSLPGAELTLCAPMLLAVCVNENMRKQKPCTQKYKRKTATRTDHSRLFAKGEATDEANLHPSEPDPKQKAFKFVPQKRPLLSKKRIMLQKSKQPSY